VRLHRCSVGSCLGGVESLTNTHFATICDNSKDRIEWSRTSMGLHACSYIEFWFILALDKQDRFPTNFGRHACSYTEFRVYWTGQAQQNVVPMNSFVYHRPCNSKSSNYPSQRLAKELNTSSKKVLLDLAPAPLRSA
jgi:hypothetical protein